MLTLILLSAALIQQTPAPDAPTTEVRTRVVVLGGEGTSGLDRDGDGQITREEFSAPLDDHFNRMDKDGDGRLSEEERTEGHGAMEGRDHSVMIRRGPGGPGLHRFELHRSAQGGHGGDREVIILGGPGGPVESGPGQRIEIRRGGGPGEAHDLDADGDGRISEAEFTRVLREVFARMDADRSGFIEAGERAGGRPGEVFVHRLETRQNRED